MRGRIYDVRVLDPISEVQFNAQAGQVLAEALRAALGEANRAPSHERIVAWITSGRVQVDDEVVRDPQWVLDAGASVELALWSGVSAPTETPRTDADVTAIHHVDEQVLVAEYTPPPLITDGAAALRDHLARLLAEAGIGDRFPLLCPAHEPRASGLVAAGLAPAAVASLDSRHRPLGVRVNVKALVREAPDADLRNLTVSCPRPGVLFVRTPPVEGSIDFLADLESRGLEVLEVEGAGPPGQRPLLLHVTSLALTHPRTGRTSMFACRQPPAFTAALEKGVG